MHQTVFTSFSARLFSVLACLATVGCATLQAGDPDLCFTCGKPINGTFYRVEDKVTLEKRNVCKECELSLPACFVCGLPAGGATPGRLQLSDGRAICGRDASTAILQVDEGIRVCRETWERIDRLFSRFLSFPEKNVRVRIVDRVHLLELYKLAGNDYECPNVWGFTQTAPGTSPPQHQISILGGMPLSFFQATCAHEYTHTWLNETLSERRRKTLSKDAEEGFCELVSFMFMNSLNDAEAKARILRNSYTRGQIDLFVAAEQQFGFNDIAEWMKFGSDDRLDPADPGRIRKVVVVVRAPATSITPQTYLPPTRPNPQTLALKAVFWDATRPTALINDRTFSVNETAKVRLGTTNVTVRCLSIRREAVRIQIAGSSQEQELVLKQR